MDEDLDNLEDFEAKDTAHALPLGWLILFFGLILFGIYYTVSYSTAISGWTMEAEYQESLKESPKEK